MPTRPDLEHLCRVCAGDTRRGNSPGEIVHILKSPKLKEKLEKFLYLEIEEDDFMPKILCKNCYRKVESTAALANIAQQTKSAFNRFIGSSLAKTQSSEPRKGQQYQQKQHSTQPPPLMALSNYKSNVMNSQSGNQQRGQSGNSRTAVANNPPPPYPSMPLPKVPETTISLAPPLERRSSPPRRSLLHTAQPNIAGMQRDPRLRKINTSAPIMPFEPEVTLSVPGENYPTNAPQLDRMRDFVDNFTQQNYPSENPIGSGTSKSSGKKSDNNSREQQKKSKNGGRVPGLANAISEALQLRRRDTRDDSETIMKRRSAAATIANISGSNDTGGTAAQTANNAPMSILKPCYNRQQQEQQSNGLRHLISLNKSVFQPTASEKLPERLIIAAPKRKQEDQSRSSGEHKSKKIALPASTTAVARNSKSNGNGGASNLLHATNVARHFSNSSITVGSVIRDLDLLKLILKVLKWPVNGRNLQEQVRRLKNSKINEILSDRNLLQDTDLTQLLAPILSTVPTQPKTPPSLSPEAQSPSKVDLSTVAMPFKLPPETSLHCLPPSPTDDKQINLLAAKKAAAASVAVNNKIRRRRNSLIITSQNDTQYSAAGNSKNSERGSVCFPNTPILGKCITSTASVAHPYTRPALRKRHRSTSPKALYADNTLLFPNEIKKEPGSPDEYIVPPTITSDQPTMPLPKRQRGGSQFTQNNLPPDAVCVETEKESQKRCKELEAIRAALEGTRTTIVSRRFTDMPRPINISESSKAAHKMPTEGMRAPAVEATKSVQRRSTASPRLTATTNTTKSSQKRSAESVNQLAETAEVAKAATLVELPNELPVTKIKVEPQEPSDSQPSHVFQSEDSKKAHKRSAQSVSKDNSLAASKRTAEAWTRAVKIQRIETASKPTMEEPSKVVPTIEAIAKITVRSEESLKEPTKTETEATQPPALKVNGKRAEKSASEVTEVASKPKPEQAVRQEEQTQYAKPGKSPALTEGSPASKEILIAATVAPEIAAEDETPAVSETPRLTRRNTKTPTLLLKPEKGPRKDKQVPPRDILERSMPSRAVKSSVKPTIAADKTESTKEKKVSSKEDAKIGPAEVTEKPASPALADTEPMPPTIQQETATETSVQAEPIIEAVVETPEAVVEEESKAVVVEEIKVTKEKPEVTESQAEAVVNQAEVAANEHEIAVKQPEAVVEKTEVCSGADTVLKLDIVAIENPPVVVDQTEIAASETEAVLAGPENITRNTGAVVTECEIVSEPSTEKKTTVRKSRRKSARSAKISKAETAIAEDSTAQQKLQSKSDEEIKSQSDHLEKEGKHESQKESEVGVEPSKVEVEVAEKTDDSITMIMLEVENIPDVVESNNKYEKPESTATVLIEIPPAVLEVVENPVLSEDQLEVIAIESSQIQLDEQNKQEEKEKEESQLKTESAGSRRSSDLLECQNKSQEDIDESVEDLERNIFQSFEEESRLAVSSPSGSGSYSGLDCGPSTSKQAAARFEKTTKSLIAQKLLAAIGIKSRNEVLRGTAKKIRSALQFSLKQAQEQNASTEKDGPDTGDLARRSSGRKSIAAQQAEALALEQLKELKAEEDEMKAKNAKKVATTKSASTTPSKSATGERPARTSKTQSKYYKDPNSNNRSNSPSTATPAAKSGSAATAPRSPANKRSTRAKASATTTTPAAV